MERLAEFHIANFHKNWMHKHVMSNKQPNTLEANLFYA